MTILSFRRAARLVLLPVLAGAIACGCERKEEIRSYAVAKEKSAPPSSTPAQPAADSATATDRMLGAIVPSGEQSWFFKVTGPAATIDKKVAEITEFFQSVRLADGDAQPVWKTPQHWQERGASGMRVATLTIPTDSQPLEMSVISSSGSLIDNVNRWRGQMQLPPVDDAALATSVKESKAGDATMWLVDLRGKASPGGMMAPFAGGRGPFSGGAGGQPPGTAPEATPSSELPAGHPPVAADGGPVNTAGATPFQFVAPESWQPQPVSGMRKAAFIVKDGDLQAEITVIDLLASAPNIADPVENVNRWRTEIGLAPIQPSEIGSVVQKIDVDGKPSDYAELIPDAKKPAESQVGQATLAAAVPAGKMIWFFKIRGDRDLVVAQRDNFKSFLRSIRFNSEGGAGDGN